MMKKWGRWLSLAALTTLFVMQVASADRGRGRGPVGPIEPEGPGTCGGAGTVPTPFLTSNQKVELADHELYMLYGTVRIVRSQPYLEVDLDAHPWLANNRRQINPLYPIEPSSIRWKKLEGTEVGVYVQAKGTIVLDDEDRFQYVLSLVPLEEPVSSVLSRDGNR